MSFLDDTMRLLFGECPKLTDVDLSEADTAGVTSFSYMFYECRALKSLDLSSLDTSSVRTMQSMFCNCTYLSEIVGIEHWDTGKLEIMYHMFDRVASASGAGVLDTVDMRAWDLSHLTNAAWCFQLCYAHHILLPDNLAVMSAGFLNHACKVEGSTYTIPAGVHTIGYAHTIYDFATNDFVEFIVADGNEHYVAIDGILYSADGKEMLAVPRNKPFEGGVYEIPEGVEFLGELSFSRNYNIHKVVLPDSYEIVYVPVYDERYITYKDTGNLNAGTNLSIAIYCYTGITEYAVKDTNPRYASKDGIIYSKDMKEVVAVPARYAQKMVIPEGVTVWNREAMWADGGSTVDNLLNNCSGVSFPSTLAWISDDQLAMLNRLKANRASGSNPFTIELPEENEALEWSETGELVRKAPIVILTQPADWQGSYGEYPSISVEAAGSGLAYQWYYRNAGTSKWQTSSDTDACYDAYKLSEARDGREVYCVITDEAGNTVETDVVTMSLWLPEGYEGPAITAQPEGWEGAYGEYPAIRVEAEGDGLTYQWYFRNAGTEKWNKSSDKDDCYDSYPLSKARDGREVYCIVKDRYGLTAKSEAATMSLWLPEGYEGPAIKVQPADWAGSYGEYPAILVEAEGDGLTYQWYYRNAGASKFSKSSDKDDCYDSYPLTKARDGREVYCVVTDCYGLSVKSGIAVMERLP
ncbi:MAG: DUF285 domain-containing protein [Clostridia bacterium]|nr:DUF285 domain-containing protein [Clostridia bacterium]